jgi:hypothetical protein
MNDNFDFDAQPHISRDQVYISWSETMPISRYIEEWLKARRLRTDDAARAHVYHAIARYPWTGPLRKADVDFYLDSSVNKAELELPQSMQHVRKSSR